MRRYTLLLIVCVMNFSLIPAAFATTSGSPPTAIGQAQGNLGTLEQVVIGASPITPQQIIGNIITVMLGIVGLVFIILVIYAGYEWGTARGNEERVENARKLIFEASIGLIIIFAAYLLTAFVVQQVANVTFLNGG